MVDRVISAILNTAVIMAIIPVLGLVIDFITSVILNAIARHLNKGIALFVGNWLTFVGVIHHELAHMLMAIISGARVDKVQLFKPQNDTLGKVSITPRGNIVLQKVQTTLTAIGPVILGLLSLYLINYFWLANCTEIWQYLIVGYLMFSIFIHMTMSKQDIKVCAEGLPICIILVFLIVIIFNINLTDIFTGAFNYEK